MSVATFAVILTTLCGIGDTDKHWSCYDYYNNCVINKSVEITVGNINSCKVAFDNLKQKRGENE